MEDSLSYKKRAQYYDIEYVPLNDTSFLGQFINNKMNSLLEVPCGTGFHFDWLMSTQKKIYLIDGEIEMINIVKDKIEKTKKRQEITAFDALMESFTLPDKVDLIIFPQESFQLLLSDEQAIKTLHNAYRNLNYQGVVVIDIADFDKRITINAENTPRYWHPEREENVVYQDWQRAINHELSLLRNSSYMDVSGVINYSFYYQIYKGLTCIEEYISSTQLRRYNYTSLSKLIAQTNFTVDNIFGNYSNKPYQVGDPRIIITLKKNAN
jgi:SAM-dependent methyltransferase